MGCGASCGTFGSFRGPYPAAPPPRFVVRSETVPSGATGLVYARNGRRIGCGRWDAGRVICITRTSPLGADEPEAPIGELADTNGLETATDPTAPAALR
jgi:hypothetical protein